MTREEAIKKLQRHKAEYLDEWVDFSGIAEALDMAIRALKNEQSEQNVGMCQHNVGEMSEQMPSYNSIKTELNGDLISRQAVITMLQKIENAVEDGDGFQFNEWIDYAKDIPSAEKTAEWKLIDAYRLLYDCSDCGQQSINKYRFCPNCGAKMKESEEEE